MNNTNEDMASDNPAATAGEIEKPIPPRAPAANGRVTAVKIKVKVRF